MHVLVVVFGLMHRWLEVFGSVVGLSVFASASVVDLRVLLINIFR